MSDKGEEICRLCMEEMDWTDQQFKPCECNYKICIWCWHHIMEMAEKDSSEGRCPACLSVYDKERIAKMRVNCERLAQSKSQKQHKLPVVKSEGSKDRAYLSSFRVILRNLVYIAGLPLELADQKVLQKKEFLGQYGKVIKSVLLKPSETNQQFLSNNSCCIYVTFSKDEEAIRCIQSINGFILNGRPLKACYGTTKYCTAWLKNISCSNRDCVYLHTFGRKEDIFPKEEVASACSSKVAPFIGVPVNSFSQRSGQCFPPPVGNLQSQANKDSAKLTLVNNKKVFQLDDAHGKSSILPASACWGSKVTLSSQVSMGPAVAQGLTSCDSSLHPAIDWTLPAHVCNADQNKEVKLSTASSPASPVKDSSHKDICPPFPAFLLPKRQLPNSSVVPGSMSSMKHASREMCPLNSTFSFNDTDLGTDVRKVPASSNFSSLFSSDSDKKVTGGFRAVKSMHHSVQPSSLPILHEVPDIINSDFVSSDCQSAFSIKDPLILSSKWNYESSESLLFPEASSVMTLRGIPSPFQQQVGLSPRYPVKCGDIVTSYIGISTTGCMASPSVATSKSQQNLIDKSSSVSREETPFWHKVFENQSFSIEMDELHNLGDMDNINLNDVESSILSDMLSLDLHPDDDPINSQCLVDWPSSDKGGCKSKISNPGIYSNETKSMFSFRRVDEPSTDAKHVVHFNASSCGKENISEQIGSVKQNIIFMGKSSNGQSSDDLYFSEAFNINLSCPNHEISNNYILTDNSKTSALIRHEMLKESHPPGNVIRRAPPIPPGFHSLSPNIADLRKNQIRENS